MSSSFIRDLSLPAHVLTSAAIEQELETDRGHGLSEDYAKFRLQMCGKNTLDDISSVHPASILVHQIGNAMIVVLILAVAACFGVGFWIEGGVITAVIILNIAISTSQELEAKTRMNNLRSISLPTASVIRSGRTTRIPIEELVPGDIVNLKSGDTVPADVRLIKAINFETNEALLTGESLSVQKDEKALPDVDTQLGGRLNVAFCSSIVTRGRGRGIVFATGAKTEIGSIISALNLKGNKRRHAKRSRSGHVYSRQSITAFGLTIIDSFGHFLGVNVGTPLQIELSKLAALLFGIALVCALIATIANKSSDKREVIIYAVVTGLSIIPVSLTAVLTITLASGIKKMARRHVLVYKLYALEALGTVTDVCLDKTGTLTQGKLLAKILWIPAKGTYIMGSSDDPLDPEKGDLLYCQHAPIEFRGDREHEVISNPISLARDSIDLESFLNTAALVSPAHVHKKFSGWVSRGDPIDIAIQILASRFDWNRERLTSGENFNWTQIAKFPFDSVMKRMSVVFENRSGSVMLFSKGATEQVLKSCTHVNWGSNGGVVRMTEYHSGQILENMESLAATGLRVLAFASKDLGGELATDATFDRAQIEKDLTFQGLVGFFDPERIDSMRAVRKYHKAGIIVRMLTGDHLGTAEAVAVHVGILPKNVPTLAKDSMVMTADTFDNLTDDEIDNLPVLPLIIARCLPNTKVRMIEALQRRNRFIAMTGDGINDSPALKQANIGIAMGVAGSEVAKQISDMVLTDDNFISILHGIKEGRRIFDNTQKFVLHLLSENIAQACVLLIGLVFKDDFGLSVFPLAPVEILWVVIATSAMPDMGLGFEVAAHKAMRRPPRPSKEGIITLEVGVDMLFYGLWMAVLCLSAFSVVLFGFGDGNLASGCNSTYSQECDTVFRARATTFVSMVWFALLLLWELVDSRRSLFRPRRKGNKTGLMCNIWQNQFLFWAVFAGFATVFPTLYIPVINHTIFKHEGLTWEWVIVIVESALFLAGVEAWKWVKRAFIRRQAKRNDTSLPIDGTPAYIGWRESELGVEREATGGAIERSQAIEMT